MSRTAIVRHGFAFVVGSGIGIFFALSAITAHADEAGSQLSITRTGIMQVQRAVIQSVSGNEVRILAQWNEVRMPMRVIVNGSTRFVPQADSVHGLKALKAGHEIAVTGRLDPSSREFILYASSLRDETLMQTSAIVAGSVISIAENHILIATAVGTSTVVATSGTIVTIDGEPASLQDIAPGFELKAFGALETAPSRLLAQKIVVRGVQVPNTGSPQADSSPLGAVFQWLMRYGGSVVLR